MFAVRQHWLRLLELANLRHHGTPANDLYGPILAAASTAWPSDDESSIEATRITIDAGDATGVHTLIISWQG